MAALRDLRRVGRGCGGPQVHAVAVAPALILRDRMAMTYKLPKRSSPVLPSDLGFLKVAGREADMPLREALLKFRDLVSSDMDWADFRKRRFRARASRVKAATLLLTAASTVVLGIPAIPDRTYVALPMVALVTALSGFEGFFNFRPMWVLMEECQYRLNRLRDEIDYYVVLTPEADLKKDRLDQFFTVQQEIWADISRRWIEFRKLERASEGSDLIRQLA
jgi:hypothetical protein